MRKHHFPNDNKTWYQRAGIPMMFQPKTLNSYWYSKEIRQHIIAQLEGLNDYMADHIERKKDRDTYLEQFEHCLSMCRGSYSPTQMLERLKLIKNVIFAQEQGFKLLLKRHWTTSPVEFKEKAVNDCIAMVESVYKKYLDPI